MCPSHHRALSTTASGKVSSSEAGGRGIRIGVSTTPKSSASNNSSNGTTR